jgi:Zn ribbon nucleic-acid-binding protein
MEKFGTHCPMCNREGSLAVANDAIISNTGPEGPLHVVGCTKCGWTKASVHHDGISRFTQLRNIVKVGDGEINSYIENMERSIERFNDD